MEATTSVTIELPPELERKVRSRAAAEGQELPDYLRGVIERSVMTLDEVLAPIRREFEASGMTEEELDALVEEAREEI